MSWESWITDLLTKDLVDAAAIYGLDGSVWAKSENFTATDEEIQAIIQALNNPDFVPSITFQGIKFITLRASDTEIDGQAGGKGKAISIAKSGKAIVITVHLVGVDRRLNEKIKVAACGARDSLLKAGL